MTVTLIDNCAYQEFCMKSYQILNSFLILIKVPSYLESSLQTIPKVVLRIWAL